MDAVNITIAERVSSMVSKVKAVMSLPVVSYIQPVNGSFSSRI